MDIATKIKNVINNIIELIKSDDEKWKIQRDNLLLLLQLHIELLRNFDMDKPNISTLNYIEYIKQWRTDNLNTEENMFDPKYGENIAMAMCEVKVMIMALLFTMS